MLGSIAKGKTNVTGFLDGEDCLRTIDMFKQLGVSIERRGTEVFIDSPGMQNWQTPTEQLYAGNAEQRLAYARHTRRLKNHIRY